MKSRKTLYIIIALVAILPLLGEIVSRQVALRDSLGVSVGMTVEEYRGQFSEGELLEFHRYGCFVNNMGYPVIVRHDQNAVQDVDIIDVSKIDRSAEGFAKLEVGMTLQQVGQIVGIPAANDSEDASVLYYLCTNDKTYMLTYQDAGTELTYVKAEMVKAEEG